MSKADKDAMVMKLLTFQPLGKDDPHFHIIDEYEVTCGDSKRRVFVDMYHCDSPAPNKAPDGYSLRQ